METTHSNAKRRETQKGNEAVKYARRKSKQDVKIDKSGREILDSTPMQPPLGYKKQPSLADQIREMVRSEKLAQSLAESGVETFEEADDFDVGDDYDPTVQFEEVFDGIPSPEPDLPETIKTAIKEGFEALLPAEDKEEPKPKPRASEASEGDKSEPSGSQKKSVFSRIRISE